MESNKANNANEIFKNRVIFHVEDNKIDSPFVKKSESGLVPNRQEVEKYFGLLLTMGYEKELDPFDIDLFDDVVDAIERSISSFYYYDD